MKSTQNKIQFSGAKSQVRNYQSSQDALRITSLGGFADVTQNMFVYEFIPNGDTSKSQIIIVDCGAGFPEEDAFGVDMQIPDTRYLKDKKDNILGIFISHGHEDHIGALRFVLPQLGKNIPIYAPKLAAAFIKARLAEFNLQPNLQIYDDTVPISRGPFVVEPIRITHSIPDSFHLSISSPIGTFYHGADFKLDVFPLFGQPPDLNHIAKVGDNGKVFCLLSDCLGADHPGFSPSERSLAERFKQEIVSATGRVFITSISSNIFRWAQAIDYAKSAGRKIVILGMSIDRAITLAKDLGMINLQKSDTIPPNRAGNFPSNKLAFLVAGFAGQPDSALSKIIMGKHRIKIKSGDKVIFSSPDYIPGTTGKINNMVDNLAKLGVEVTYGADKLHVSGHGYQKELGILINLLKPKYLLPIGGNYRHVKAYKDLAKQLNYNDDSIIIPDQNNSVTFYSNQSYDTKYKVPFRKVLIDGLGVGDVGTTVLRDRRRLAEDGMLTIVLLIDKASGQLVKEPTILSRGFVFVQQQKDLLSFLQQEVVSKFKQTTSQPANLDFIREQIQGHIEDLIFQKTGRQPMVLPLTIEV